MKICTKCEQEKPFTDFHADKSKKDSYSSSCKICKNSQNQEYANQHKEQKTVYDNLRRQENRETINKQKREYYHTKGKTVEKVWRQQNWKKILAYAKNSKAKRRAIERTYDLPSKDLIQWIESQDKVCTYCFDDCASNYHVDHVIPLSRNGLHSLENLTIACPTCNISKSNKTLEEWEPLKQQLIEAKDKKL